VGWLAFFYFFRFLLLLQFSKIQIEINQQRFDILFLIQTKCFKKKIKHLITPFRQISQYQLNLIFEFFNKIKIDFY
jgi:hypothetical protein